MRIRPRFAALACAVLVAAASGCRERSSSPQRVTVEVRPRSAQVPLGGRLAFAADVTGTADRAVAWEVVEPDGGTVDLFGAYTAPTAAGVYHVKVTSRAEPAAQDVATVTVSPTAGVEIFVSPASGAVHSCQKLAFAATVTGASDTSVTWSVEEGAAGGSIDAAGSYTAPDAAGTYHVVATSNSDPARSAIVPVDVTDLVVSVAVAPATAAMEPGATARFAATVTTTCGTYSAAIAAAAGTSAN